MSEVTRLTLRPLTLSEAIEKFRQTAESLFQRQSVTVNFATSVHNYNYQDQLQADTLPNNEKFLKFLSKMQEIASMIECNQFLIQLQNANQPLSIRYVREKNEPSLTALITIECNIPDLTIQYLAKLKGIFEFISMPALFAAELPKFQKEAFQYQESIMASLRAEVARIGEFNLTQAKTQADFITKSTIELDQAIAIRQQNAENQIEEKRKSLEAEYQTKLATLEKRDEELRRKTAEADARDSMIVRRQLLTDITNLINREKEFEISDSTSEKRNPVKWTIYCSIFGSSVWVILFVVRLLLVEAGHATWLHYAPIPLGMVFLVSSIVYLIKWSDQWAREHAHAEMRNKKMKQDILRASWLAEMFFEGKDKERLLPDMLISRFSEGLFQDIEVQTMDHPYDHMVDLLKKISSVKIGKDTVEVNKEASKEKS